MKTTPTETQVMERLADLLERTRAHELPADLRTEIISALEEVAQVNPHVRRRTISRADRLARARNGGQLPSFKMTHRPSGRELWPCTPYDGLAETAVRITLRMVTAPHSGIPIPGCKLEELVAEQQPSRPR